MNFIYLIAVDRQPDLKKIDFPLWAEVTSFILGGFQLCSCILSIVLEIYSH